ncbi:response regulator [Marinomonas fungiae]|uniref:CheY chemotaxis protein or a CheY-like REC (Receiver) domain n=1 Tax=Marinomonas fungiae TaxID=1137284 RepID=A0A0K6IHG5_9GAMM|nr:response regulator [Marinomonas fungiae]CUB02506.1 CheY chemotaxis protein or a CheY-like REC (receiver) domain [Marinomonas fungiae]
MADISIPDFKNINKKEENSRASVENKRVLIVEDIGEMRLMLKSLMTSLGYSKIDIEPSGQAALKRILDGRYDIVLSDYNLGGSVDGQQLLEVTRKTYALDHSTIFMMITADTAYEAVVSVLEYQPDSYLVKPFPPEAFMRRLGRVVQQKKAFHNLNQARLHKDWDKVIEEAKYIMSKHAPYESLCLKSIGESLYAKGEYKQSKTHYMLITQKHKNLAWAYYGMALSEMAMEQYPAAAKNLETTINLSRHFLSAYDLLADAYEKMENLDQAKNILISVLEVSPRSPERSKRLGDISIKLQDWAAAEQAYSRVIRLNRDTINETVDMYYDHLQAITNLIASGHDNSKTLNDKFKRSLTRLRIIGKASPVAVTNSFRIEVQQYVTRNHLGEAIKTWQNWHRLIQEGKASPLSEAQEYTLKKRLGLI